MIIIVVFNRAKTNTVNDESLEGLKFGESAKKSIWRKKVWRISPRILLVYNILAIYWRIKFGEISQFAKFAKLWSLQTFVVYGILNVNEQIIFLN